MPIPIICPCAAKLKVGDHLVGKYIKCPKCGEVHPVGAVAGGGPVRAAATTAAALANCPLSDEEKRRAENALDSGERIVWAGKPDLKMAFARGWILSAAILSVAVVFIVIACVVGFAMSQAPVLIVVILGLLGALGTAAGIAAPYYQKWRYAKHFYILTNQRATVWDTNYFGTLAPTHYSPAELSNTHFDESTFYGNGAGDVVFKSKKVVYQDRTGGGPAHERIINYGFLALRTNGNEVTKLVRETLVDQLLDQLTA
jgi:hypothetical protein